MGAFEYIAIAVVGTLIIVAVTVPLGYLILKRAVREGNRRDDNDE